MREINYELRPYTNEDYEFVYQTKKNAYKIYVEANWGEWNEGKQREMFVKFIEVYGKDIKIVLEVDKRIGFYHCEELEGEFLEIGNICIILECQGRGIGTRILKGIIGANKDKNIYLRYFKQNPVQKLYERLGFERVEELQYHYKMILKAKENVDCRR